MIFFQMSLFLISVVKTMVAKTCSSSTATVVKDASHVTSAILFQDGGLLVTHFVCDVMQSVFSGRAVVISQNLISHRSSIQRHYKWR